MKTRAPVAFEAKKPLEILELDLERPRPVRCWPRSWRPASGHTDPYTPGGFDSERMFPSTRGMSGRGQALARSWSKSG